MLAWRILSRQSAQLASRQTCAAAQGWNHHYSFAATTQRCLSTTTPLADEDDDDDDDDAIIGDQDERTRSIAEAIAAYKAEESLRMADKIEEARKEGERAALARAEQDLILAQRKRAFEEWQRNLELAKQQQQEEQAAAAAEAEQQAEAEPAAGPVHPVLGPVLSDLGYKRLHVVPSSVLENVPVWERQRIFRYDRSKTMAADKAKTLHLGLPGIICLFEDQNGKLSVLDG